MPHAVSPLIHTVMFQTIFLLSVHFILMSTKSPIGILSLKFEEKQTHVISKDLMERIA